MLPVPEGNEGSFSPRIGQAAMRAECIVITSFDGTGLSRRAVSVQYYSAMGSKGVLLLSPHSIRRGKHQNVAVQLDGKVLGGAPGKLPGPVHVRKCHWEGCRNDRLGRIGRLWTRALVPSRPSMFRYLLCELSRSLSRYWNRSSARRRSGRPSKSACRLPFHRPDPCILFRLQLPSEPCHRLDRCP